MCERTEGARAIEAAARELRQACEGTVCVVAGEPLKAAYNRIVRERVPIRLLDVLHGLPEDEGRPIQRPKLRLRGPR